MLGRKTYQIFAAYWPNAPEDDPIAKKLNSVPKGEVARLKQQPGSGFLSFTGSGKLAQTLMQQDLVDEYDLWIHPLVLGSGKRLFAEEALPINLKLVDTKTTSSGIVILTYQPARRALASAGIQRLEHLVRFSEIEIKQLHGIGPNALARLRRALAAKGLSLIMEGKREK